MLELVSDPNLLHSAGTYLFNNRNTKIIGQICPELTIKTAERRHCRHCGVFVGNYGGNFEQISHIHIHKDSDRFTHLSIIRYQTLFWFIQFYL